MSLSTKVRVSMKPAGAGMGPAAVLLEVYARLWRPMVRRTVPARSRRPPPTATASSSPLDGDTPPVAGTMTVGATVGVGVGVDGTGVGTAVAVGVGVGVAAVCPTAISANVENPPASPVNEALHSCRSSPGTSAQLSSSPRNTHP